MNVPVRAYAAALLPRRSRPREAPGRVLTRKDVRVDVHHLAAYTDVCGLVLRDRLPLTYPHVLAFPQQLALLTAADAPLPALGLVHLRALVVQHRAVGTREVLALSTRYDGLRAHRRGAAAELVSEARVGDELVWSGRSTYLARGTTPPEDAPPVEPEPSVEPDRLPVGVWALPGDLGRRYAAVSGDANPIHLHPLTARPLGFARPVAHGMWSAARLAALLEPRLPDAVTLDVAFAAPVPLPSRPTLHLRTIAEGRWEAALRRADGRAHLVATVAPVG